MSTKEVSQTRAITIKAARSALRRAISKQRPVFLWGPVGVGKSELVQQIAEEDLGGIMIDLRMANLDPTDVRGIPYYNQDNCTMSWAAPVELPNEELASKHKVVVLFLDELNSAPPAVQAATYQLILNRKIGTYTLPDNVVVVAAGNRDTDRGVTYRMPSPLANRFVHLEVKPDFDCWLEWAGQHGEHPDVISFLYHKKQKLHDYDPKAPGHAFPTPRSWHFVSELIEDDDDMTTMELICGSIGEATALEFKTFRDYAACLPDPAKVLDGDIKKVETKELSALFNLVGSLSYELKQRLPSKEHNSKDFDEKMERWYKSANNYFAFVLENFSPELAVVAGRMAIKIYRLPVKRDNVPSFDAYGKKYAKMIVATEDVTSR